MHDYSDESRTLQIEAINPSDLDPPEPIEVWTLEDFDDLLTGA